MSFVILIDCFFDKLSERESFLSLVMFDVGSPVQEASSC